MDQYWFYEVSYNWVEISLCRSKESSLVSEDQLGKILMSVTCCFTVLLETSAGS